ncbi:peptide ABC transporter substrate-binding protein [Chloroflexota bacterium]
MKRLRWQLLIILLTLVLVGVLLIRQQPVPVAISPQPASGGIYTEGIIGSFNRLNPLFEYNNQSDQDVNRLLFSGLIKFDSQGNPVADLAESWGVSLDGMIYNFSIRPNAYWHDGQPITSADVIFTLELMQNEITVMPDDVRSMWEKIEVIELNEKTLRFELSEPFAPFMDYLEFAILPRHLLENISVESIIDDEFNLHPVGSGPYQFDSLIIDNGQITGVILKAFEDFYTSKPYIEQIVFQYYPDAASALEAYQMGEVMGISQITSDILDEALADPNLDIYSSRMPLLSLVLLNLQNPEVAFFQETEFRNALMQGLNRQWMIDHLLHGQAFPAHSPILPGNWAYFDGVQKYSFNINEAIETLVDLGYERSGDGSGIREKDGLRLSFTMLFPDDALHLSLAEAIQRDWLMLGIQVNIQPVPFEEMLNNYLSPREYQAALVDLDMRNDHDPDPYPFWHQSEVTGGQNYSQWDNRSASEYIEQARVIVDSNFRSKLYRNFQIVFSRELPALPLYFPVFTFGVDTQVSGVQLAPIYNIRDRFLGINDWYLLTRRSIDSVPEATARP